MFKKLSRSEFLHFLNTLLPLIVAIAGGFGVYYAVKINKQLKALNNNYRVQVTEYYQDRTEEFSIFPIGKLQEHAVEEFYNQVGMDFCEMECPDSTRVTLYVENNEEKTVLRDTILK